MTVVHVTQELLDEARRVGLGRSPLIAAAIKKAGAEGQLGEPIRFILPDGQVIDTDGSSWPPLSVIDGGAP